MWRSVLLLMIFVLWPLILSAQTITHTLTWQDNSDNEDGFKIEQALGLTGAFSEISQVAANATTAIGTVSDQQNRCYRVRAFNSVGNSAYTNVACSLQPPTTPPPTSAPNAPTTLAVQETVTP